MSKRKYVRDKGGRFSKVAGGLVNAERKSHLVAGGPSFDIGGESSRSRKIRRIRKLTESGSGGEKDAAKEILKKLSGPSLPTV